MNFIETYLEFNSGNECPKPYHVWTALTLLAATAHKKVSIDWGYFEIYPNLFVCLVGKQGLRKSTAKDIGSEIFKEVFPDYPVGASVQSREDIIRFMSQKECIVPYMDKATEALVEVRPIVIFINELKNFMSVDPQKMVEFLTDIYDRKHFKSSTIKRGLEDIVNPCVNILACETPEWITDKLKSGIISGGWSRRMIYVYELEKGAIIPFPARPFGHEKMLTQLKDHLKKVWDVTGKFRWTEEAREHWRKWYDYHQKQKPDDEILAGYYESKHIQVLKVAMLLCLADFNITSESLLLTPNLLELATALLDSLEKNMPKLSQAAGRNEFAMPMQKALELLELNEGWLPEKTFKKLLGKDLKPMEVIQVMRFLQETGELAVQEVVDVRKTKRLMVMTPTRLKLLKEETEKAKQNPPQT
jgi:hypothetical protein